MEIWSHLSTLMYNSTQAWMNFESGLMTREKWEFTLQSATYLVDFPFGRIVTETPQMIKRTRALAPRDDGE